MIPTVMMLAVGVGLGATLLLAGLRRRHLSEMVMTEWGTVQISALGGVKGATRRATSRLEGDLEHKQQLRQDAAMIERSLETHAFAKLGGTAIGAVLAVLGSVGLSVAFGVQVPLFLVVALAAGLALLGWWLPDSMLESEADAERARFQQSAEAWLELVAQLVTAGSDTHAALGTASAYSEQSAFVSIRNALDESSARAEPPWIGLRRLADERRLRFLDPFVAALELAGTTGAGARQAILSQVDAARSKSLHAADAKAASASEQMGAPLALIGGAFMMLMGYPPLASIMDSSVATTL